MSPENPHLRFLLFLAVAAVAGGGAAAGTTLTASLSGDQIKIRWSGLPAPDGLDYVGIYSPPSSRDRDFLGYLFLNGSASWRDGAGELSLPRLPTLRAPYQFRLFRWPANEYSYHHIDHDRNPLPHGKHRVAVSGDVSVGDPARPEQVHLAFADGVDEMRVLFVCGDQGKRVVRYGLSKEDEKEWKEVGTEVSTYEQKHMCDLPANGSVGWRDPGFVFDGLMKGLEPGRRYFYKAKDTKTFASRTWDSGGSGGHLFPGALHHLARLGLRWSSPAPRRGRRPRARGAAELRSGADRWRWRWPRMPRRRRFWASTTGASGADRWRWRWPRMPLRRALGVVKLQ